MKTASASQETAVRKVAPAAVGKLDALLLDVRTPAEFAEVHIEGSILHPLGSLNSAEVGRLMAGKSECVVICRSGNRASQAAEKLKVAGIGPICVLDGGIQGWESTGCRSLAAPK